MDDTICNVFISHINEDDAKLSKLKNLVERHGYQVRDSSIDSTKPNDAKSEEYIKIGILGPRIEWAGTVIVLISAGTHESKWVDWEIERAEQLGKRIVGVWAEGAKESDLPTNLDLYADAVVGWNAEAIIDAINGKNNEWTCSNGEPRTPRPIKRYSCRAA